MSLSHLETKIKVACLWAKGEGWDVQPDLYLYPEKKCCCPLTALAMHEGKLTPEETHAVPFIKVLAWSLILDDKEVFSFTSGFDQVGLAPIQEYAQLGRTIRKWYDQGMP